MKRDLKNRSFVLLLFCLIPYLTQAQYSVTKIKDKHQAYTDSLKQVKYNYTFPFLGQKAYQKGFDIPYPAGMMGNFMWMDQGIVIDNMQLGLTSDNQDIPLTAVDFIQFGDNTNTAYTVNLRPDLWVLPFLNVYGIIGYGHSKTEVNLVAPIKLNSVVEQNITTAGVGFMLAGGLGPVWFSLDANWTWNKPELLDRAVPVNVLGLRFGHTFVFKNNPKSNIGLWVGGMRATMGSSTVGQIQLIDALPNETWDRRDEIVTNYWNWYDNEATLVQQAVADEILTPIVDRIDNADGESIIKYGMEKQVKEKWNGVIGMQYQINKKWMIRSEAGLIGDRKSFLLSLNYRFLL